MHHKFVIFPFTAIVGQENMKKALLINAIDPTIGGIVISGDKGTGKSTAVRALAHSLPKMTVVEDCSFHCHPGNMRLMCKSCQQRFEQHGTLPGVEKRMEIIDMPLSATEDMVIGAIDIKKALSDGIKALEPGILARANRNILYIDEVNLLDDHLINILLDAAAMGVNVIEREGISLYHPARFILVGTMNPEEGNLRPQILDRFGLCVEVNALTSREERLEVITRRKEFDRDCWAFEQAFLEDQRNLSTDIMNAQELLPRVDVPHGMLEKIVHITSGLGIKTHRADIVMEKTCCVLAALEGRTAVTENDVIEAALLALPHRMRQRPFDKNEGLDRQQLEHMLAGQDSEDVVEADKKGDLKKNFNHLNEALTPRGGDVHREDTAHGLYTRARPAPEPKSVAIGPTIAKAVKETGSLQVLPEHFMEKVRRARGECLYIIVLDSSSSMRMKKKIRLAKNLSWLLLKRSYEKKNRVALIVCRGEQAEIVVPPTKDVERLQRVLDNVPTGGKTPLTPALFKAGGIAARNSTVASSVIVISDGRGNVFEHESFDGDLDALSSSLHNTHLVLINAENPHRSLGFLENMAERFGSPHFYLEEVI